jgi:deazaflavin-dependent oxidoreductase (nitroreductase family)
MRHVNRVITNPLMGRVAWLVPPLAVVHHVGRKSGRRYRTPVVAFPSADGFTIPLTYGRDVDWGRNLVAERGGEVQRMGRRFAVRNPRIVGFDAAASHLPAALRPALRLAQFPGYVLLDLEGKDRPSGRPGGRAKGSRRR